MESRLRYLLLAIAALSPNAVAAQISTSTSNSDAAASTPAPATFEVDVIFPRRNVTYNLTEALPIVFAVQNISNAGIIGDYTFEWDIMPWGNVGGPEEPGGVLEDSGEITFASAFSPAGPHIVVNATNAREWTHGPRGLLGSVYALQWYVVWNQLSGQCQRVSTGDKILFNVRLGAPEPDLLNLPECPQLGAVIEVSTTVAAPSQTSSPCLTAGVTLNTASGSPCAVTADKAMASSVSSVVYSIAAAAASTSTSTPTPTPTKSAAAGYGVATGPMLAAAFILGALELAC